MLAEIVLALAAPPSMPAALSVVLSLSKPSIVIWGVVNHPLILPIKIICQGLYVVAMDIVCTPAYNKNF